MSRPGVTATSPWVPRRRRAEVLRDRYPFAAEVLTLYLALLDVWEEAWGTGRGQPHAPRGAHRLRAAGRMARRRGALAGPVLPGPRLAAGADRGARRPTHPGSIAHGSAALPALRGTAAAQLPRPLRRRAGDRAPAPRLRALLGELELRRQRLRVVRGNRGRAAHRLRRAARAAGGGSWRRQRLRADLPAPPHRRLRELQAISDRRRPRS